MLLCLQVYYRLKVFADKNIHYTSPFPGIKVPSSPLDRENASIREKILYAVHSKSNTPLLQRRWARDATILSAAISEVGFDKKNRCHSRANEQKSIPEIPATSQSN